MRRAAQSLASLLYAGLAESSAASASTSGSLIVAAAHAPSLSVFGSASILSFIRSKYTYQFKRQAQTPGLIFWKPTTPGQRHKVSLDFKALGVYNGRPAEELSLAAKQAAGRDDTGRIRVRGRGGGIPKVLRMVDFTRQDVQGLPGVVERIEYDPHRSGFLALTRYEPVGMLPFRRYHLAPAGVQAGDVLMSGQGAPVRPGSVLPLSEIPAGVPIHNVELRPGRGGQLARAANTAAYIEGQRDSNAIVKLPSGELRLVPLACTATVGQVSNHLRKLCFYGKAGARRHLGWRPKVRGVAKNAIDHPHGGSTPGGRPSCTPWGVYCKGTRTRRRNAYTNKFILMRKGGQPIDKFVMARKAKPDGRPGAPTPRGVRVAVRRWLEGQKKAESAAKKG